MKRMELERAIQEQSDKISKSQIIPKCRDVAKFLGKGGRTSKEWATSNYVYRDDSLKIDYQVYAFGDERLTLDENRLIVFSIKEIVNNPPKNSNPLIIEVGTKTFEVLLYHQGTWEQKIETLYLKTTDVAEEELKAIQQRYGVAVY